MPRLYRIVLTVGNLPVARNFYRLLLGEDGMATAAGWHSYQHGDMTLLLRENRGTGTPLNDYGPALYIAVDEPLVQLHYRAQSAGALRVDPQISVLPTGEQGFRVQDPSGNILVIVDGRGVPWRSAQAAVTAAAATSAAQAAGATWTLQRDFINAVKGGNLEAVHSLLQMDPSLVDATDSTGVSAMMHAAYKHHTAIADFLVEHNHALNLWEAAAFGRLERLEELIAAGGDARAYSPDGFTALGLACFFGHPACATTLLERGADPNAPSRNDMQVRPLHSAVARASEEAAALSVKALIARGADVNATQQGGYTALHQAAERGQELVVKYLLSAGARADLRSTAGRTALDHARLKGHDRVVAMIRKHLEKQAAR